MLENDLQVLDLILFIQFEDGKPEVPEELRAVKKAQALQYVRASVNKSITLTLQQLSLIHISEPTRPY